MRAGLFFLLLSLINVSGSTHQPDKIHNRKEGMEIAEQLPAGKVKGGLPAGTNTPMTKAVPTWGDGREKEMNLNLGFRAVFTAKNGEEVKIKIAASTIYRVFINGEFVGSGPARAAHGYFRVDEYPVGQFVKNGENVLAIEVAGYNINTYYTLDQPSFLQAEAEVNGKVVLATGSGKDFEAFQIKERLQKVERYSFQRPFSEYYRMKEGYDRWRTSPEIAVEKLELAQQPTVQLLPRNVDIPQYKKSEPIVLHSRGTVTKAIPKNYRKDRSLTRIGETLKGFTQKELEVYPVSQEIQEIVAASREIVNETIISGDKWRLKKDEYSIYDFGTNLSGFIGARIKCSEASRFILYFDEILMDDDVKTIQRQSGAVSNHVTYELQPGEYDLETLESYTFKYLKVIVLEGECQIEKIYLREFAYPDNEKAFFESANDKLNKIFDAAKQTFRQNTLDVFMDCPSRERAGWLCDSYFSAVTERELTGYSTVSYNFLENYALPESFACLPEGMIPMCYPADHYDGSFIANWSLWFILQVEDYLRHGGDPELVARLKPRIEKLLGYFSAFENEDGLLEKLENWVFVEWSKANEFVQDVSYPTNMLYSAALACAGTLYGNDEWTKKAEDVRAAVLRQSYNGSFFVDNAVRENGELKVTANTTEACQYYAFFFNIATPDSHPDLWKKLVYEFGPDRDDTVTYPNVFRANAFIGNYLRMDILSRYNQQSGLISEIQNFFYPMAAKTGTLWEHMQSSASCNHGFASYIGHVLYRDILGIKDIDYVNKSITVRFADFALDWCKGSIPVGEEMIKLEWVRSDGAIRYALQMPEGYTVKIENESGAKLISTDKVVNNAHAAGKIDRRAVVERHRVVTTRDNSKSPAQVGNGEFAFGVDITGLQTFNHHYTMSNWGWHSFPLPDGMDISQFRGKMWDYYGRQIRLPDSNPDQPELSDWLAGNPHRFNLGRIGLVLKKSNGEQVKLGDLANTKQEIDLWTGIITSTFEIEGIPVTVTTAGHTNRDAIGVEIVSPLIAQKRLEVEISFPYPDKSQKVRNTYDSPQVHHSALTRNKKQSVVIQRTMDDASYNLSINWKDKAEVVEQAGKPHFFRIVPRGKNKLEFSCEFSSSNTKKKGLTAAECITSSKAGWESFWKSGAAIDLSESKDPRWKELERRIVLSQYLLKVNEAGSLPPQESGLVNNGWFGRFHFEMIWWHGVHYALWDRWNLFDGYLGVFSDFLPSSIERAKNQGFEGVRWPKCTANIDREWPCDAHATLLWQQPHPIYFAELDYRLHPTPETLRKWEKIVFETADFLADFAHYDKEHDRYVLGPPIYMVSENEHPAKTINPTFELSYWRFGLRVAQIWKERLKQQKVDKWDQVLCKLAPLPVEDGVYVTYEGIPDMWTKYTFEHPALTGVLGMLPGDGVDTNTFVKTLDKVFAQWQYDRIWGWDYPMMAMAAARTGQPAKAVDMLLYPSKQFRFDEHGLATGGPFPYFPSNGGLLTAVAFMAAGWDGCPDTNAPGFPKDGSWVVKWEGLKKSI